MIYILTVRKKLDEYTPLVANLGVFQSLKSAVSFVIEQKQKRARYFEDGISTFITPGDIDAYLSSEFGERIQLFNNDSYIVSAEAASLH
jgi:hypothetical protein